MAIDEKNGSDGEIMKMLAYLDKDKASQEFAVRWAVRLDRVELALFQRDFPVEVLDAALAEAVSMERWSSVSLLLTKLKKVENLESPPFLPVAVDAVLKLTALNLPQGESREDLEYILGHCAKHQGDAALEWTSSRGWWVDILQASFGSTVDEIDAELAEALSLGRWENIREMVKQLRTRNLLSCLPKANDAVLKLSVVNLPDSESLHDLEYILQCCEKDQYGAVLSWAAGRGWWETAHLLLNRFGAHLSVGVDVLDAVLAAAVAVRRWDSVSLVLTKFRRMASPSPLCLPGATYAVMDLPEDESESRPDLEFILQHCADYQCDDVRAWAAGRGWSFNWD